MPARIRSWVLLLTDPMGNQTIYALSKPTLGKVHKESWFEFQVPDGVNVIRVNVAGTPAKL